MKALSTRFHQKTIFSFLLLFTFYPLFLQSSINLVDNEYDEIEITSVSELSLNTADIEVNFTMDTVSIEPVSGLFPEVGTCSYSIQVTNQGPMPATNLSVILNYHDDVVLVNTTVTAGYIEFQSWVIPNLDVGETVYLNETSKIIYVYGDKWVTTHLIHSDQDDPDSTPGAGGYEEDDSDRLVLFFPRADLELSLSVNDPNYEIYETVEYELTVYNDGPTDAPGLTISFPFPPGMVYSGSNTSLGTFSEYYKIWTVGTLTAGESATLNLDLFTLDELGDKLAFAQVMTHERIDPDAYPGNDTDQVADEDDETSVIISAPTGPLPDLLVAISSQPNSAVSGSTFTTFFDLENIGPVAATVSTVKAFLSEDNTVSDDDLLVGSQSMFTAIAPGDIHPELPIEISIPVGTLNGLYKLILFADADLEIPELKEYNNFSPLSFHIFGGPSGTCESASSFPWHEWISLVQINEIDNSSGKTTFSDFSAISTDLAMSEEYAIQLQTSFSFTTYDEYWRVWIDFNGNGSLFDPGDLVVDEVLPAPLDGTASASLFSSFSIPDGLNPGIRKMRVSMKRESAPHPCSHNYFGEVEDYTINIVESGNSEISIDCIEDLNVVLPIGESLMQVDWDEPTAVSTCPGGTVLLNQTGGQVNGSLFPEGVYIIEYEASDDCGNFAACTFVLTVMEASGYCDSQGNYPWHEWISEVSLGGFTNGSGKSKYSDLTFEVIEIQAGEHYNIDLTTGFSYVTYDEYWRVWIDYDKNGIFDPVSELFFSGILSAPSNGTGYKTLSSNANVPIDAPLGLTRMRVSMKRGAYADPCEMIPFGEVEDYLVDISPSNASFYFPGQGEHDQQHSISDGSMVYLFPNPASFEINLSLFDWEEGQVEAMIQDVFGRLKSTTKINLTANEPISIPLVNIENGIYFITIKRPNGKNITKKFIVESGK